jgi:hypothetical protein
VQPPLASQRCPGAHGEQPRVPGAHASLAAPHTHSAALHASPYAHVVRQLPQWRSSPLGSRHAPSQHSSPERHALPSVLAAPHG